MKRTLLLLTLILASCAPQFVPRPDATLFTGYVALGDSITAGYQSASLTPASQRASYPHLLGQRAGLDVPMPEIGDPGCPPPVGVMGQPNCERSHPDIISPVVAVPGAKVHDVLATTDTQVVNPDPQLYDARLYRAILGSGTTQLEAAIARKPVFVTVWIGSNDVLLPTLRGDLSKATPVADFQADYTTVVDRLKAAGAHHLVLMTVPDVTRVPALVPVRLLRVTGLVDRSCDGQDTYFGTSTIATASQDKPLSCTSPEALTRDEYVQAQAIVEHYNAAIRAIAASHGAVVFDVNPVLDSLPGRPLIPTTASPFGRTFSLDGVHPSSFAHDRFARALAAFMNEQFGTSIDPR
ncbi:SGNH/GDSL hydrolase family protein [Deinococcus sp. KSM4-11]|uniref:GDSL-type esterase/lipase family protein n=1 Tax=Deinococcus sp. KSM4-11 TaxID=2568654 RepID=UPI0010A3E93D|nr:GDSL-type esterase/lipase family protein [Deinococcus sp. KSM4-11]THF85540.1 SGNH/GDSL hydrolase family protein [Deinococcus sp. KSM4-11]